MELSDLHGDLNGFHFQDPGKLDAAGNAARSAPPRNLPSCAAPLSIAPESGTSLCYDIDVNILYLSSDGSHVWV